VTEEFARRRAASFGRVVGDYERGRPGYPEAVVSWLVGSAEHVVDLGAGTGKLTGALITGRRSVVALEPQEAMVEQLHASVPGANAVRAGAEAIPIRSHWADVVVVAQAWHWFDQARAVPEIDRVLRPGGRLSLVWNVRDDSVDWVAELSRIAGRDNSATTREWLDLGPQFGELETLRAQAVQLLDMESLLAHVRSRSNVAALPEGKRAGVMRAVARLCATHPGLAGKRQIEFPYITEAYRALKN
jgi:SAM-dependent methyltransferase